MTTTTDTPTVTQAAEAALLAFSDFAACPAERRADLLDDIAARIDALGDGLTDTAHRETHLPAGRLNGERGRTVNQLRMFARLVRDGSWVDARIEPALPDRQPLPRPDLRRMLEPLGPVAVFGASNFPLAFSVAGGDTASALAAGCPVVCKSHPAHPDTGEMVAGAISEAVEAAGLPAGVFTLIHTDTNEQNLELVRHPAIRGVGFTGSHRAGRALFDAAAERRTPIPVFAEMSSVNPMVLLPGAVAQGGDAIAKGLHGSVTLGVGQFCTKPGVVFVIDGDATDRLIEQLATLTRNTAPAPMLHPGIVESYTTERQKLIDHSAVTAAAESPADDGDLTAPASLLRVTAADAAAHPDVLEECFGPTVLIVTARNVDEVEAVLDVMPGQLTATLHVAADGADDDHAARLLPRLRRLAGRVLFNGYPTGVEVGDAMQHGGPYPATTDPRFTSVGAAAILRWARPVCYQDTPAALLPPELRDENPRGVWRRINSEVTRDAV